MFIGNVIVHGEVVQLADLRLLYIQELERNGFPNPDYRSNSLKARIEKHEIRELINFTKTQGDKGCIEYILEYSANIALSDAVARAYRLGSEDELKDVALLLRNLILQGYQKSTPLPWPPSAEDLVATPPNEFLPPKLVEFLSYVVSGELTDLMVTRRLVVLYYLLDR